MQRVMATQQLLLQCNVQPFVWALVGLVCMLLPALWGQQVRLAVLVHVPLWSAGQLRCPAQYTLPKVVRLVHRT